MSNRYVHFRDGGKSDQEAMSRLLSKIAGSANYGYVGASTANYKVEAQGGNLVVVIKSGDFVIPYSGYFFHTWTTSDQLLTLDSAHASFGRIDRIVAYVDLVTAASFADTNNLDDVAFMKVSGTPSGSPAAVDDASVQTAVGGSNPWKELARVTVGAAVTSISDANITDYRSQFILGGGVGGADLPVKGDLVVANDLTDWWIAPKAGSFTTITARVKTAPTGAALNLRVNKNGVQVATLSISAGSTNNSGSISVSFSANDYFSLDITQVGSTVPGAYLAVALG